jgi:acyl-CoA synthetase (NDP forming)
VEIMKDRAIRVVPVDEATAGEMIEELKGSSILRGARGRTPADVEALKSVLVRVSRMLVEHPEIVNIDINPVIVLEDGRGCVIVDAKVERFVQARNAG